MPDVELQTEDDREPTMASCPSQLDPGDNRHPFGGGVFLKILTDGNPVVRYWKELAAVIRTRQSTTTGISCTQTRHTGKGKNGFSNGSSSDGLTDEQEREIAENIYDWWISGMSYKKWYAERFLQYELEFDGYI